MVKFVLEYSNAHGRIGKILHWGNIEIQHNTPSCITYTRAGHIPHLTWDVATRYINHLQSPIYQLTLPSFFDSLPVIEKFGKGVAQFSSMPKSAPTHLTLTDPLMERNMKFNNGGNISIWTRGGRRDVNVNVVKKLLKFCHVSSYETLFDYATPEGCSTKRLEKAVERTINFSKELLSEDFNKNSVPLIALCGGHSRLHHERCASALGSNSEGCGFVLDVMQFAKRLRFFPKKSKSVAVLKAENTKENDDQVLPCADETSESIEAFNHVLVESEFNENAINNLLSGVWPHISSSHLRMVNGAFSPSEVVTLTRLGVDLFDSSYAIFLAEQGKAFVCDKNFPQEPSFSVLNFSDEVYAEDFAPVCETCDCYTCKYYSRSYLKHLINAKELFGLILLVIHNIQEYERMFALLRTYLSNDRCILSTSMYLRLRHLADESKEEQKYREAREALNEWSSQFWANHNALFERKRAEFVKQKKQKLGRLEHSSAVDMSEFYKDFLDRQYGKLTSFNREWYYRNISLFWPAFKVQMIRFRRSLRNVLRK
ncbi:unnamed protein product [Thelazia callipaeda]|uniref:Queuine tRNA-ribosyltransferase accessory subunit 2 n=1 Tax=Thelazia callipaeda TaxID=103827 RepID=A0A0N5D8K4_THECL|nr:unnamed protein product [Thelazia callipaeda]